MKEKELEEGLQELRNEKKRPGKYCNKEPNWMNNYDVLKMTHLMVFLKLTTLPRAEKAQM